MLPKGQDRRPGAQLVHLQLQGQVALQPRNHELKNVDRWRVRVGVAYRLPLAALLRVLTQLPVGDVQVGSSDPPSSAS